jgi:hypothetical protein
VLEPRIDGDGFRRFTEVSSDEGRKLPFSVFDVTATDHEDELLATLLMWVKPSFKLLTVSKSTKNSRWPGTRHLVSAA